MKFPCPLRQCSRQPLLSLKDLGNNFAGTPSALPTISFGYYLPVVGGGGSTFHRSLLHYLFVASSTAVPSAHSLLALRAPCFLHCCPSCWPRLTIDTISVPSQYLPPPPPLSCTTTRTIASASVCRSVARRPSPQTMFQHVASATLGVARHRPAGKPGCPPCRHRGGPGLGRVGGAGRRRSPRLWFRTHTAPSSRGWATHTYVLTYID